MIHRFKPLTFLILVLALAGPAPADEAFAPVAAADVVVADHLFVHRPVVVFADSPDDPNYLRQMALLERGAADLAERDVIVVTDTDPANPSELRHMLRPTGFSLVLMDKDWKPTLRKPLPWDVREITRAIDKMPLASAEALERHPSGR